MCLQTIVLILQCAGFIAVMLSYATFPEFGLIVRSSRQENTVFLGLSLLLIAVIVSISMLRWVRVWVLPMAYADVLEV